MHQLFIQPLEDLANASPHRRLCPEFPDADFLQLDVQRVQEGSPSGRAFLQESGLRFAHTPGLANYFAALGARMVYGQSCICSFSRSL